MHILVTFLQGKTVFMVQGIFQAAVNDGNYNNKNNQYIKTKTQIKLTKLHLLSNLNMGAMPLAKKETKGQHFKYILKADTKLI